jgi:hypothetical protein
VLFVRLVIFGSLFYAYAVCLGQERGTPWSSANDEVSTIGTTLKLSHSTIQLLCSFFFINGEKNEALVVFLKLEWCVYTLA